MGGVSPTASETVGQAEKLGRGQRRSVVRRFLMFTAPLLAAAWLGSAASAEKGKKPAETCNGDFGTSVHFEKNKDEAARKALKEEKLVCILHISGHFEDPNLT